MFKDKPVPGVTVTAAQDDKKILTRTDADGIFRLVDLAAGVWTITVEMLGFSPIRREITVPPQGDPL